MAELAFYMFGGLLILASVGVIAMRQPIHSVLCLIFAFVQAAGLYILLGADFIALATVMVYVGAVAVLFIFVVMTFKNEAESERVSFTAKLAPYKKWLLGFGALVLLEAVFIYVTTLNNQPLAALSLPATSNIKTIGAALFTRYGFVFQMVGLILLVSMIGVIVLVLRSNKQTKFVKRQDPHHQRERSSRSAVTLVDPTFNNEETPDD